MGINMDVAFLSFEWSQKVMKYPLKKDFFLFLGLFLYKQEILSLKNLLQNFDFDFFLPLRKPLVRSQSLDSLQVAYIWTFFDK
jgi:hypothetical protein